MNRRSSGRRRKKKSWRRMGMRSRWRMSRRGKGGGRGGLRGGEEEVGG